MLIVASPLRTAPSARRPLFHSTFTPGMLLPTSQSALPPLRNHPLTYASPFDDASAMATVARFRGHGCRGSPLPAHIDSATATLLATVTHYLAANAVLVAAGAAR